MAQCKGGLGKPELSYTGSFLSLPASRISRAGSRESFATDLSLLSLSSFASEMSTARSRPSIDYEEYETQDPELAKLRERMLERVLESKILFIPKLLPPPAHRRKHSNEKQASKKERQQYSNYNCTNDSGQRLAQSHSVEEKNNMTDSEQDLVIACATTTTECILKGSLCKSFSTSDVTSDSEYHVRLSCKAQSVNMNMKPFASLEYIPNVYVQMLHCRRKHLKELRNMGVDELIGNCNDEGVFFATPLSVAQGRTGSGSGAVASSSAGESKNSACNVVESKAAGMASANAATAEKANAKASTQSKASVEDDDLQQEDTTLSPTSDSYTCGGKAGELVPLLKIKKSAGPFMRKLRFSRDIGRRIRDDLLRKLSKHKHRLITQIDLDREKGKPVTKYERNFMIFHWLQSLDDENAGDG